jgi:hypothetical protein
MTVPPPVRSRAPTLRRRTRSPPSLISNGLYTVMMTTSGAGYLTRNGMAVTRWREDGVRDSWRSFCYLRDVPVVELDGAAQAEFEIKLVDDGREHAVRVVLGSLEGKR